MLNRECWHILDQKTKQEKVLPMYNAALSHFRNGNFLREEMLDSFILGLKEDIRRCFHNQLYDNLNYELMDYEIILNFNPTDSIINYLVDLAILELLLEAKRK